MKNIKKCNFCNYPVELLRGIECPCCGAVATQCTARYADGREEYTVLFTATEKTYKWISENPIQEL